MPLMCWMCLSGYIFWSVNDARSSILIDNLNDFSRLISCPSIPKSDFTLCWLGLGNVLNFFRFRFLYLQLLSSSRMLVFLWRPFSIYLLTVFLDIWGIIAWKWPNFFGRHVWGFSVLFGSFHCSFIAWPRHLLF